MPILFTSLKTNFKQNPVFKKFCKKILTILYSAYQSALQVLMFDCPIVSALCFYGCFNTFFMSRIMVSCKVILYIDFYSNKNDSRHQIMIFIVINEN